MRSFVLVPLILPMLLAGCQRDVYKPKEEIIECPDDNLVGHDTASDTGDTDPADTADTSGGDTTLPVDTGADTGADTSTPVDTGTDTGTTDTGASSDTSSG